MDKEKKIPKPRKDLTGQCFGYWKVIKQDLKKSQETQKVCWECECVCGCGTHKTMRADALKQTTVGGCNNMLGTHEKECPKCHKKFYTKKQAKTRRYCYDCVPELEHRTGAALRQIIKNWALEYKGKKCQQCGYDKCSEALEFHHLNPQEKDFNLSDRDVKLDWDMLKIELDKCILVCSNCHREIHYEIRINERKE